MDTKWIFSKRTPLRILTLMSPVNVDARVFLLLTVVHFHLCPLCRVRCCKGHSKAKKQREKRDGRREKTNTDIAVWSHMKAADLQAEDLTFSASYPVRPVMLFHLAENPKQEAETPVVETLIVACLHVSC